MTFASCRRFGQIGYVSMQGKGVQRDIMDA